KQQKPAQEPRRKQQESNRQPQRFTDGSAGIDEFAARPPSPDIPEPPRLTRPPRRPRPQLDPDAALDVLRGLRQPATAVKGVGDRMAESFHKLGVHTLNDLLYFLPRRYDDYTQLMSISKLRPNMLATVIGTVREAAVKVGPNQRKLFELTLDDGSGLMDITF